MIPESKWNSLPVLAKRGLALLVLLGLCATILLPLFALAVIYYTLAKPAEWAEAAGQWLNDSPYGRWADHKVDRIGCYMADWVRR